MSRGVEAPEVAGEHVPQDHVELAHLAQPGLVGVIDLLGSNKL